MPVQGLFIVVSAPSGAGKTTVCREFLKMYPNVVFSVSFTTRPPRPNERDGGDYHFVSDRFFRDSIDQGEFIEWEENFGYLYGTSRRLLREALAQGRDVLLDIDPRGAQKVKENLAGGVYVFMLPGMQSDLEARLTGRGEGQAAIRERVGRAKTDMSQMSNYDYLIVNEHLPLAINCLAAIYTAEKCRLGRLQELV